jgi:tRNA-splicing ligase RtcB
MGKRSTEAPELQDQHRWKKLAIWTEEGYYLLQTQDTGAVPVRLFLTPALLEEVEELLYQQIVNATRFPGVRLVVITPDAHYGYGVPVGSVILTDLEQGAIAMGPVGFDIGCGMMSARSEVPAEAATYDQRLAFNRAVMRRVEMGVGGKRKQHRLGTLSEQEFERLVRGGAEYYVQHYGATFDRSHAERHRIPVDAAWRIPWGGKGQPERGIAELGSLGGGNHFIELQRCKQTDTLFVQVHTGSRGFGHGLATNYFALAQQERPREIIHLDLGYFLPDSPHYQGYLNAVAAGGNYAILNRLIIFEQVAEAFREVFHADLDLIYEISHNLVQREWHPDYGEIWVHRKGATRAFPGGHPALAGTEWEKEGHPVLIPGSNKDESFILRPLPGAVKSAYSVNHGAGRRMSRSAALRELSQQEIDRQYHAAGIPVNVAAPVPLDEAAPCYKSAQEVVEAVVGAGLARVEYSLWPLSSLKGTETRHRVRKMHIPEQPSAQPTPDVCPC